MGLSIFVLSIRRVSITTKKGDIFMRVMVLMKANEDSEQGVMPDTELLTAMGNYNEELMKAGLILAGEGLQPGRRGVRVHFGEGKPRIMDGPFAETKELIAGFWIWQVSSMEEAVEWVKRMPQVDGSEQAVEIRPVFEMEDFGEAMTPELAAQETRLRAAADAQGSRIP